MCNQCSDPSDGYYVSNKSTCKKCIRARATARRNANLEEHREYDRKRGNRQPADYLSTWRANNPRKYKAHNWINNALRDGRIMKPATCEECPGTLQIEGHHDDYSKPTEVRWLCAACHAQWHAANGEALNP